MLDRLIGTEDVSTSEADIPTTRSPLRATLLENTTSEAELYQTVTELTVMRARLREHQEQRGTTLSLRDLLSFVGEYEAANEQMINTSPYSEAAEAVQLMTVFKAKGLEFGHVFLINCQDEVWGSSSRGNSNKLTLPANLAPIRHAGANEDERLRIFFVAISRAKYGLHLTSHAYSYAGKKTSRLKYLAEIEQSDGSVVSQILPAGWQTVQIDASEAPSIEALEQNWQSRHTTIDAPLRELLRERLDRYRLSPTHLTKFIDLEHAGPQSFLLQNLLHFPSAPSVDIAFGNAMHETMEWLQQQMNEHGLLPLRPAILEFFSARIERASLTAEQLAVQQARGSFALEAYLNDSTTNFVAGNRPEQNFRDEGVVLAGDVLLGGKIDLLAIDQATKTIIVIDYKTGSLGSNKAKLHKYELQLYCYKILIEGSHTFRGYSVNQGQLVFLEPNTDGKIIRHTVTFTPEETEHTKMLLQAMWQHVQKLDMPIVSKYGTGLTDIRQFEQDLIDSIE